MLQHKSKPSIKKYKSGGGCWGLDGHTHSHPPTLYSSSTPCTAGHNLCSSPASQPALPYCRTQNTAFINIRLQNSCIHTNSESQLKLSLNLLIISVCLWELCPKPGN